MLWDHAIDPEVKGFIKLKKPKEIKKVILCSGKIYFDLLEARKVKKDNVIFYRIEQLYPFSARPLQKNLNHTQKKLNFIGARRTKKYGCMVFGRDYIQWTLDSIKANSNKISYIGRSPDASPATGYAKGMFPNNKKLLKKFLKNNIDE